MRRWLAALVGLSLLVLLMVGFRGLPAIGHYRGPYGDELNRVSVPERHAANSISAVNFDYRGFDTLGEEFMLFAAVSSLTLLLRRQRREEETVIPEPRPTTAMTRWMGLILLGPLIMFGLYVALHAQTTPGGGFQGGAILACALLQVYMAADRQTMLRCFATERTEVIDCLGAALYPLAGLLGLAAGAAFLQNVLPLGTTGGFFSAGTMMLINFGVFLEVTASFLLMLTEFVHQLSVRP